MVLDGNVVGRETPETALAHVHALFAEVKNEEPA
jgi:hypothetical protein